MSHVAENYEPVALGVFLTMSLHYQAELRALGSLCFRMFSEDVVICFLLLYPESHKTFFKIRGNTSAKSSFIIGAPQKHLNQELGKICFEAPVV